jgi:hypothetical protein
MSGVSWRRIEWNADSWNASERGIGDDWECHLAASETTRDRKTDVCRSRRMLGDSEVSFDYSIGQPLVIMPVWPNRRRAACVWLGQRHLLF